MTIGTHLLVILVLMLIGVFPTWPHSRGWGYGPSGGLGFILLILLVLVLGLFNQKNGLSHDTPGVLGISGL